ncbi:MAG: sulfatase-like hydrolase/transferase [Candidatus Pacebacteria bacterium]|nr:sulfatase-like hydrolase/transferase [Candidatus Paceibacterota bacterium]
MPDYSRQTRLVKTLQRDIARNGGEKPNILFIMTDQLRHDCLGYSGNHLVETPNLDQLARASTCFTNAYTPSPVCAPARAAIFSGRYPPGCGVTSNWLGFKPDVQLLTTSLKAMRYTTANIGKLHFVPHTNRWGFDCNWLNDGPISVYSDDQEYSLYAKYLLDIYGETEGRKLLAQFDADELQWPEGDPRQFILGSDFIPEEHHMTTWSANTACRFLHEYTDEQPFFLHLSFFGPHQPWQPPGKWARMVHPDDVKLPVHFEAEMDNNPVFSESRKAVRERLRARLSERDYREIIAAYYGQVSMIDHYIGKIVDKLREKNLWHKTLIVFCSDHGEHLGHYGLFFKGDMYDTAAKVPLLIKPAEEHIRPNICEKPVTTLDIHGTLLEAAGCPPDQYAGKECGSLLRLITQPDSDNNNVSPVFSIIGGKNRNTTMLRKDNLKLIRLATEKGQSALYELYDMDDVPVELINRFDDPRYREERDRMLTVLDKWWTEQNAKYSSTVGDYRRPENKEKARLVSST